MRRVLVAGNWKMNKTPSEAGELAGKIEKRLGDITQIDIVICPPYPALSAVYGKINESHIKLGAQNIFWEREGAYTGEVSTLMLRETGCHYVIIGHSERRIHFGETDAMVNKKLKVAIEWNLVPILCVGEKLEERQRNETEDVVRRQLEGGLDGLSSKDFRRVVVAYEPIWAIGTGKTATPRQANEVHKFIRQFLTNVCSQGTSQQIRILYGGSVKPDNISALIKEEDIDGALVGGASIVFESFAEIVERCMK